MTNFMPESYSKFILAFGVGVILDPFLILVIDLLYHHYDCQHYSNACRNSYSSFSCNCYNGDFSKLWLRTERTEGSGITGFLITIMLAIGSVVASTLIVYIYLLRIHRDARILDMWRRINGDFEEFFIPDDFEISYSELKSICSNAKKWRGLDGSTRKVILFEGSETMMFETKSDLTASEKKFEYTIENEFSRIDKLCNHFSKRYQIIESDLNGGHKIYRQFIILTNGSIVEIFDSCHRKVY
jgi:hypothetical protein